ncbi:hypothetical protein CJF42_13045 [Pseudoalteromonas sp. NBT06-2]|uniref:hypothetical protein n=1 Tax=Pseudoalteromonas sp. NBT06-2 TaxID=2025950 RepID=UPI000BA6DF5B|nr:hypothetical protein [Pseudoalteromonas sp. NBT06-2]PAJ73978.1 hypothetical protein CJF42_13045 [Pseudoalteromonas sp. NBT06-2]
MINSSINIMGYHITQIETQYIPLTKDITLLTERQLKQKIVFERDFGYTAVINEEDSDLKHFNEAKNKF